MITRKWIAECHAFVDEKEVEGRPDHKDCMWLLADNAVNPITYPHCLWRIRTATITINGVELPKPTTVISSISPQFVLSIDGHFGNPEAYFYFSTRKDRDLLYSKLVEVLS